ncbi:class I adenylate-forming enzyme family protein [Scopulibacillus cellulosilyticus]|uniref:Class I adenylate-forming enzyme family protein n=1 Tax=Scopulibacillus cellulosilyticus TaxID=2665665 RepID=A0ABW2PUP3_9BACL
MLLTDLLKKNIETFGEYPFLYFENHSYSNLETLTYAKKAAWGLRHLGIKKGDRVIVCIPNMPEVIFSYQAIARIGAVIVPVMYLLHGKEIGYIAGHSEAKAIITSSEILPKVKVGLSESKVKPSIITVDQVPDEDVIGFYELLTLADENETAAESDENIDKNDTAVVLYTSGTTGKPKGVRLTHKNLYSNAESAAVNNKDRGTTIGVLPLAHVYGLTTSNVCFLTGSSIVIFSKFDVSKVFQAIETYKVRSFSVVPAMVHAMLSSPDANLYDLSSLERVGSGSAPMPLALIKAFKENFNADVFEGYGLSEAAPVVTTHREGMPHKPGSVGVPIPGVDIRIVDEKDHQVPTGEIGELIVRGDNVTPGYFQNDEETKKALKGGWLHTGDLARVDEDGYLYIVDRKKDLIIRGGFNIYPRDLEELLVSHESVSEAAVIGVPDDRMGEEVLAYVVKKPETTITEADLLQFCQMHLAKNKTPRKVIFVDALPRNGVGKILKTELRELAQSADLFS